MFCKLNNLLHLHASHPVVYLKAFKVEKTSTEKNGKPKGNATENTTLLENVNKKNGKRERTRQNGKGMFKFKYP